MVPRPAQITMGRRHLDIERMTANLAAPME